MGAAFFLLIVYTHYEYILFFAGRIYAHIEYRRVLKI